MLRRLPIPLAQVKAVNTSENLLNEIRQSICSLYRTKEIAEKVYNNIMNSIKLQNRMDTIFIKSGKSKTSDLHRPLLNLSDKTNFKRSHKYVALSNLSNYYTWKKKSYQKNKSKISAPTWNEEFELTDGSYSVLDIPDYFEYIIEKHETVIDNPLLTIYVNKIENKITFKIKTGYYLEFLTPETMKFLI